MSIKVEASQVAEHGPAVSNLAGRTSFTESRMARALCEGENGPRLEWIRRLYERMPDAVFFITDRHGISACNRAAVTLFGYEESELLGRQIDFVWSSTPDVQLSGRWASQGAVRAGLAITKNGVQFPTVLTIIREQGEEGAFAVAIVEDFRAERETLQQVQELQRELARLARVVTLGEMTSTLAHELSQPLSSIAAYSQGCGRLMMKDRRRRGEELRVALSEITQQALWAGTVVQNIRDFARRGACEKKLEAMHALIHEAATLALAGSPRNNVHVEYQLEAERDIVLADRVQIVQVLTNLLRNALDATDRIKQPYIVIRSRGDDSSHLVVEVSDNGCGIAAEMEETLFRPFVTSKPRGLGMGLALSRRIIEAHGGCIIARNRMGSGSTLSFSLPLVETKAHGERPYDPSRR